MIEIKSGKKKSKTPLPSRHVLPQALRAVIPAIVGQFIALFMDTTLAIFVGLMELLAVGRAVLQSNPEWLLRDMEV